MANEEAEGALPPREALEAEAKERGLTAGEVLDEKLAANAERWCIPKFAVELIEAKPNPMFTESQRQSVRFMRFYELGKPVKVACAHCGRKRTVLWTRLCSFRVQDMGMFVLRESEKVYAPLTPVCRSHITSSEVEEVPPPTADEVEKE